MAARSKLKLALGILLLLWALSLFASTANESTTESEVVSKFLAKQREYLLSKDAKLRGQAVSRILEERKKDISILVAHVIQDERMYRENPDALVAAMKLLGKMRATEAVGILAEHLDFQDPRPYFGPYSLRRGREAVDALIEIGKPSVPAVIREVLREKNRMNYVKMMCAVEVIERVEGKEMGVFYLRNLFEKNSDPANQAILQKLMEILTRKNGRSF